MQNSCAIAVLELIIFFLHLFLIFFASLHPASSIKNLSKESNYSNKQIRDAALNRIVFLLLSSNKMEKNWTAILFNFNTVRKFGILFCKIIDIRKKLNGTDDGEFAG